MGVKDAGEGILLIRVHLFFENWNKFTMKCECEWYLGLVYLEEQWDVDNLFLCVDSTCPVWEQVYNITND